MDHLAEMAIVRRDAFVNGQWISIPMLKIHRPDAAGFTTSPSDQLRSKECPERAGYTLDFVLRRLPRAAFDYLWLVNLPSPRWPSDPGLTPVWHGPGNGILYRISKPGQARQSEEFAPELSTPR
jgi:hypothetical protein